MAARRSKKTAAPSRWRIWFHRLLPFALAGFGLLVGFLGPYVWVADRQVREAFGRLTWQVPTRVMAQPLELRAGRALTPEALEDELRASRYVAESGARQPGTYSRSGERFVIATRGFTDLEGAWPGQRLEVTLGGGRVTSVRSGDKAVERVRLDPARIATLYGEKQEERRLVRLEDVPPLLLTTLQAVEDRDFKHHIGIDVKGMLRAMWVNLRHGEVRQGASTLTQQLVRNLYLTREQRMGRKLREILYALIIEARFDKRTILEAYVNQVYLGQQGGQAVHGIAAGAEFWFGRELEQLSDSDIALLVGLIQGPSAHDPRRRPESAKARREHVLRAMLDAGLIDKPRHDAARERPLGIARTASLSRNRYPAFMALVRDQLQRDYTPETLRGAGLTVLTTLSPSAQNAAETAVATQLSALEQKGRPALQAGLVLSDTGSGEILAIVGARDPGDHGFNRALDARRPVGSLLKPFVHLLALAQPDRYSLATRVDDAPITLRLPGNRTWSPENVDGRSHGRVTLRDALAHSYNQATVRIGMDVGVERLARLLDVLAAIDAAPLPSLLLGSVDLSPLQMAQAYQFIASGGQIQPLRAVRGVLDPAGVPLKRYDVAPAPPQRGDTIAARLVSIALQDAVTNGTARSLSTSGLAWLRAAGKTGTSNDSRDSWFVGFTGSHLAVVWVGNDANQSTGLYGSTGAMKVWGDLFRRVPTLPLRVDEDGLEWGVVDEEEFALTHEECPGAQRFAFVAGYLPMETRNCRLARLRQWFGPGEDE
ncbi:penicillin-binding protein 1B [Xanthomonadaceae bacterium XH05]|nr:penicillin-binding protein 1B [Xanthomonadaceae bacterium XH05]